MSDGTTDRVLHDPKGDRAIAALGARRRRLVLLALWDAPARLSVGDVIVRGSGSEQIERELRRIHLPMLEEAGYIEWDRETGEVSKGPNFEEIEPLLELLVKHEGELPSSWP